MGQIINNIQAPVPPPNAAQIVNNVLQFLGQIGSQPAFKWLPPYGGTNSFDNGEVRATVETSWANVPFFPSFMLGDVTTGAGGYLKRIAPQKHPVFTHLRCVECNLVEGRGAWVDDQNGLIKFVDSASGGMGAAIYSLVYRPVPYSILTDQEITAFRSEAARWVVKETVFANESLALPGNSFQWKKDGQQIPEGITINRPILELHLKWMLVPDVVAQRVFDTVLDQVQGRINNETFAGYKTHRVLCMPPKVSPLVWSPSGVPCRHVDYSFMVRLDGTTWNEYYRRSSGKFEEVVGNPKGDPPVKTPPYQDADFNKLFKFG